MLIQFSFESFKSFKEEATLSLAASQLKDPTIPSSDAMADVGASVGALLHAAAVYGANASGKSNMVKAMETFKWLVLNSQKELQAGERIRVESYRLNSQSASEPSSFEIVYCDPDNQYRYGFAADSDAVRSEWLYQKANRKRAKEVELLFRENGEITVHGKMPIVKDLVAKRMVRDNALLLSVGAQFNDPICARVTEWLSGMAVVTSSDRDKMWKQAVSRLDNPELRKRIVAFSKYADLGIEDIEKVNDTVVSRHVQYDNGVPAQSVAFVMDENESEGTVKYFRLAYPLLDALDNGSCLVIDELDSQLHPVLVSKIVSMFNSAETNPRHAQLIFTLHDTNVLNGHLLRRDQVWFTQKDRLGESELYSLAEYNVRNNAPFEKEYLAGKYGAIPVTGDFNRVMKP